MFFRVLIPGLPSLGKEGGKQLAAFLGQDDANHDGMVIQALDGEEIDHAAMDAGLGISRTIDHPRNPRVQDGACTHRTRFKGDKEFAAGQPIIAKRACRIAQR